MTITLIAAGGSGRSRAAAAVDLLHVQPPASAGNQPARAVQSDHRDFVVDVRRLEVGTDPAAISAEWIEKPRGDVEQRHVVIARHDDLRERQAAEKRRRLLELPPPRALRQIARHRNQIGMDRRDAFHQRRDDALVEAAEVQIGEMNDRAHRVSPPAQGRAARRATIDSEAAWQASAASPSHATLIVACRRRIDPQLGSSHRFEPVLAAREAEHRARKEPRQVARSHRRREIRMQPARVEPRAAPSLMPSTRYSLLPTKTNGVRAPILARSASSRIATSPSRRSTSAVASASAVHFECPAGGAARATATKLG